MTASRSPDIKMYVGSLLSVTTNANLRYEGTVIDINKNDRTLSLRNVICCGSEGRKTARYVPRSEKPFHWIIFNASDIEDLQVLSSSPASDALSDPAIIAADNHYGGNGGNQSNPHNTYSGGGGYHHNNHQYGGNNGHSRGRSILEKKNFILAEMNVKELKKECLSDFNFQANNEEFDKDLVKAEFQKDVELSKSTGFHHSSVLIREGYNPTSSFYDDISSGLQYRRPHHSHYNNYNNGSNNYNQNFKNNNNNILSHQPNFYSDKNATENNNMGVGYNNPSKRVPLNYNDNAINPTSQQQQQQPHLEAV